MGKAIAVAALVVVVAFAAAAGGFLYGRNVGQTQAQATRQRFFEDRFGTATGQGASPAQGGGQPGTGVLVGGGTVGVVKSVNGNTIEISTRDAVVTVTLDSQTVIEKSVAGTLADIQEGQRVTVVGSSQGENKIAARRIQLIPAGGGSFGRSVTP
jgi:hypothetical protein